VFGQLPDLPIKACASMRWFRSNVRLGSRLALCALAIQFVLAFGHFHDSYAQPASTLPDATAIRLQGVVHFAATQSHGLAGASQADVSRQAKTSPVPEPDGAPTDDCAVCGVIAHANALAVATPPNLPAPQAAAFLYLSADAGFVDLNSARAAFQPRAPPIC
jgi:hypothetical protein